MCRKENHCNCEENWKSVLSESVEEFGGLNILLNSAGITLGADFVSTSFDIWKKVHDVNLDGVFLGCKYALPLMSQNGLGSIINLSSISGIVAGWNTAAYNSSKAAVRHLTKSIALYCVKKEIDVRCNSIHPVFTRTAMVQSMIDAAPERNIVS